MLEAATAPVATLAPVTDHRSGQPLQFSPGGLPTTVLPPPDPDLVAALEAAAAGPDADRRQAIMDVVARYPRSPHAWAALGDASDATVDRYAAYRVGYHRGLDALRANGWRGSGYVRHGETGNDGFLRALAGLGEMATAIGEDDEAERISIFLHQLDPH